VNGIRVDSIDDPRLAGYARVGDERWLAARGWFVAEGRLVVERLLTARRQRVLSLLVNEAALAALAPALVGLDAPIFVCAPRFFERLSGHHFHRGCLALAERPAAAASRSLLAGARALVVFDRVADPDNVGSVFRTALAFGVDAVWLGPGCADPFARKAIRTSMAATLRVPFARWSRNEGPEGAQRVGALRGPPAVVEAAGAASTAPDDAQPELVWPGCLTALREQGFAVLALSPREPARDLSQYAVPPSPRPFALIVGSEGAGLSPESEAVASERLRIAMRPGVDSLNLGVAAGIALHWLTRL
jgi:tRNA G18 (ribose-2'-O)-methylase SpoU